MLGSPQSHSSYLDVGQCGSSQEASREGVSLSSHSSRRSSHTALSDSACRCLARWGGEGQSSPQNLWVGWETSSSRDRVGSGSAQHQGLRRCGATRRVLCHPRETRGGRLGDAAPQHSGGCWSIQGAQAQRGQHRSATPLPCHNKMSLFQPPRPCGTPTPALPPGRRCRRRQPCGWRWLEVPRLVLLKKRAGRPWSLPQRGLITTSACVGLGLGCPGAQQAAGGNTAASCLGVHCSSMPNTFLHKPTSLGVCTCEMAFVQTLRVCTLQGACRSSHPHILNSSAIHVKLPGFQTSCTCSSPELGGQHEALPRQLCARGAVGLQ